MLTLSRYLFIFRTYRTFAPLKTCRVRKGKLEEKCSYHDNQNNTHYDVVHSP